jgi:hypothetical protein
MIYSEEDLQGSPAKKLRLDGFRMATDEGKSSMYLPAAAVVGEDGDSDEGIAQGVPVDGVQRFSGMHVQQGRLPIFDGASAAACAASATSVGRSPVEGADGVPAAASPAAATPAAAAPAAAAPAAAAPAAAAPAAAAPAAAARAAKASAAKARAVKARAAKALAAARAPEEDSSDDEPLFDNTSSAAAAADSSDAEDESPLSHRRAAAGSVPRPPLVAAAVARQAAARQARKEVPAPPTYPLFETSDLFKEGNWEVPLSRTVTVPSSPPTPPPPSPAPPATPSKRPLPSPPTPHSSNADHPRHCTTLTSTAPNIPPYLHTNSTLTLSLKVVPLDEAPPADTRPPAWSKNLKVVVIFEIESEWVWALGDIMFEKHSLKHFWVIFEDGEEHNIPYNRGGYGVSWQFVVSTSF